MKVKCKLMVALVGAVSVVVATPSVAPKFTSSGVVNGVYKSANGTAYVKVANASESGFNVPLVLGRPLTDTDFKAPHAAAFDERIHFQRVSENSYVSQERSCVATLTVTGRDSFKVVVNSKENCFVKHSQFNTASSPQSYIKEAEPFIGVNFKQTTNPQEIRYFSHFE